jgi:hypothetical protein
LYPTAAIKLAFDVERLTGFGSGERASDLEAAFGGSPERLADLANKYGASYVVLRRDGEQLGLVDLPANALRGGRKEPQPKETNHYEYLPLGRDDLVRFSFVSPSDGPATVSLRARRRSQAPRVSARLVVNGAEYPIAESETPRDEYAEIRRPVVVRSGQNDVRFEAGAEFELARFVAYTASLQDLAPRFELLYEDSDAVVLRPRSG